MYFICGQRYSKFWRTRTVWTPTRRANILFSVKTMLLLTENNVETSFNLRPTEAAIIHSHFSVIQFWVMHCRYRVASDMSLPRAPIYLKTRLDNYYIFIHGIKWRELIWLRFKVDQIDFFFPKFQRNHFTFFKIGALARTLPVRVAEPDAMNLSIQPFTSRE